MTKEEFKKELLRVCKRGKKNTKAWVFNPNCAYEKELMKVFLLNKIINLL